MVLGVTGAGRTHHDLEWTSRCFALVEAFELISIGCVLEKAKPPDLTRLFIRRKTTWKWLVKQGLEDSSEFAKNVHTFPRFRVVLM